MLRTILTGVALLAISLPAAAEPAKDDRAQNEQEQASGDQGSSNPRYEYDPHARGPYYGALVPPPPETFGKDYPVCSDTVKDSCLNPNQLKRMREEEAAKRAEAENQQEDSESDGEGGE